MGYVRSFGRKKSRKSRKSRKTGKSGKRSIIKSVKDKIMNNKKKAIAALIVSAVIAYKSTSSLTTKAAILTSIILGTGVYMSLPDNMKTITLYIIFAATIFGINIAVIKEIAKEVAKVYGGIAGGLAGGLVGGVTGAVTGGGSGMFASAVHSSGCTGKIASIAAISRIDAMLIPLIVILGQEWISTQNCTVRSNLRIEDIGTPLLLVDNITNEQINSIQYIDGTGYTEDDFNDVKEQLSTILSVLNGTIVNNPQGP